MRKVRKLEPPEERKQRLLAESLAKREQLAADDAAVERMISRNIAQFGP